MKTKLLALILVAILFTSSATQAASGVLLRLNLQKGTTYEMTMVSTNLIDQEMYGQKIVIDQKMNMIFSYQVLDVLPGKNFLIEYSMQKMDMDMNVNGMKISFNSESPETNPSNKILNDLTKIRVKFEMTPKGSIEKVEGLSQFAKVLSGNQQMAQTMKMFLNEKNFIEFMGQTFSYFPEKEVERGEKWTSSFILPSMMNMETIMNYEVASVENETVTLNVTSDVNLDMPIEQMDMKMNMKATGTQAGTMVIDLNDGWVRQSDLTQKFDVTMKVKNPQNREEMEIPMKMNENIKTTVIKK